MARSVYLSHHSMLPPGEVYPLDRAGGAGRHVRPRGVRAVIRAPLLAAAVVAMTSLSYDPMVLVVQFTDGTPTMSIDATSPDSCAAAVRAIDRRLWRLEDRSGVVHPIRSMNCIKP